jgi:shikimate kinase
MQKGTEMESNIILVGFMGTGKTTVGRQLAAETGRNFYDMDVLIEEHAGMSVPDIFEQKGEKYFRELERRILTDAVKGTDKILAAGGGIVLNPDNVAVMKQNGIVIALAAQVDTLWERLKDSTARPLLKGENPREKMEQLYTQRTGLYQDADFIVHVDGKSPSILAKEIVQLVNYIKLFQKGSVSNR